MNYYKHHIGDFDKATRHLTRIERSIYSDLIDLYYDTESQLPDDIQWICRRVLAHSNEEATAVEQVLKEFFVKTPKGWYHDRCEAELDEYKTSNTQKSVAGKASAEKRRLKREQALNGNPTSVEQPCNGTPTNHEPLTINHEPVKENVVCDAKDACNCPHQEIINLYHEILPTCPRVKEWTPARKAKLKARWNESEKRQSLDYWKRLFEYIAESDFLMGRTAKPFYGTNLEWIVTQANFTKIIEQNYENR